MKRRHFLQSVLGFVAAVYCPVAEAVEKVAFCDVTLFVSSERGSDDPGRTGVDPNLPLASLRRALEIAPGGDGETTIVLGPAHQELLTDPGPIGVCKRRTTIAGAQWERGSVELCP